jgi:hypothetical protein
MPAVTARDLALVRYPYEANGKENELKTASRPRGSRAAASRSYDSRAGARG